jgi:Fic family protein
MRRTYLWQRPEWPNFHYNLEELLPALTAASERFGQLAGMLGTATPADRSESEIRALVDDAVTTSAIEGEKLDPDVVRASIVRRLSLPGAGVRRGDDRTEGVVEVTLDALEYAVPVTAKRLFEWHAMLFPIPRSGARLRNVGHYRDDADGPMSIQSGPIGKVRVHYEAVPADRVSAEMERLLAYVESASTEDAVIRAAIVHLWFLLIHPFEDGNGRIARALADLMLGRARGRENRYCSLSRQILLEGNEYYEELEAAGVGAFDVTRWVRWFLGSYARALTASIGLAGDVLRSARFWAAFSDVHFNERQRKVVRRLLDGFDGKMNAQRWARMTGVSHDTANRDLADLVEKEILVRDGGSKNTSYRLHFEHSDDRTVALGQITVFDEIARRRRSVLRKLGK